MARTLKILAGVFLGLVAALMLASIAYVVVAIVLWGDLDRTELVAKYGGDNLHSVHLDGVEMHYRLDGDDNAPAVLLIHSHYYDSKMWDGWVATLAEHFRVIRFDMTSHGLTGPEPNGDYSMARDIDLIERLLAHLAIDEVAVVGSSLGGNMAFYLAAQPDTPVTKLVLINSGGLPKAQSSTRNAAAIPDWAYRILYLVPTAAWRAFIEWMVVRDEVVTDALVQRFHDMQRLRGNRQAEMTRMASFDVGNPYPALARIAQPVLILWGADNPQLPVAQMDALAEAMTSAASVERRAYRGVGHLLPVEMPEAVAVVEKFLRREQSATDE